MKRNHILTIIACGAGLALSPSLHAQDAAPAPSTTGTDSGGHQWGGHRGGETIERLTTELSLTPDQQAKIKPILDQMHSDMQSLRSDTTATQEDKMTKMKAARDKANGEINDLLTADQQTKFAAMIAKMHNRRGGPGGGGGAAPAATP